ncbi:MAG: alginate lyase family protein [Deltaproteobacteria bacterium]|nr:alginate lyase family protein [Deltaproteobacteria bacterium]
MGTVVRTVRHLRFAQAWAQLHHALFGIAPPRSAGDPSPALALAAPAAPYLPPPAHVKPLGGRRFELLATAFEIPSGGAWAQTRNGPLFAYHLHQHEWLRCDGLSPAERAEVLLDWIRSNPGGVGWDPHPTGLRLLAWGKLLTTAGALPDDRALRETLLCAFADQAETLSQGLEIRLQANHLLSNLLCVVFAGLLVESAASAAWRARAGLLLEELARQVHPDGGHEERSPMYHAALEEGVLDVLNLCRARPERAPTGLVEGLAGAASRMQRALELLCHGDGRIALFADAGFDIAAEPRDLRAYATQLGVPLDEAGPGPGRTLGLARGSARLEQTGYVRLEQGDWLLLASVGGPAPAHQPGHAHCDALAFELSLAGRRLVTDTGVFEYRAGPRRERSRATASHATIGIDGEEQAELWSAHRVGGRPEVVLAAGGDDGFAEATCRGWSRPKTLHRRRFRVNERGVEIEDSIEGPVRSLRACLPIEPGWAVELRSGDPGESPGDGRSTSGASAFCRHLAEPGLVVEIELPAELVWHVEEGAYYPSFGRESLRPVLVGVGRGCSAARTRVRRVG